VRVLAKRGPELRGRHYHTTRLAFSRNITNARASSERLQKRFRKLYRSRCTPSIRHTDSRSLFGLQPVLWRSFRIPVGAITAHNMATLSTALRLNTISPTLQFLLPSLSFTRSALAQSSSDTLRSNEISLPLFPTLSITFPAIHWNIPQFLPGLWDSVLRAVPKKKTSYMKKRSRQMAGKGLKDVTSLNRCPACGNVKRAHLLCPTCVKSMASSICQTSTVVAAELIMLTQLCRN
jgi:large subunit ribosomal protein L32